MKFLDEHLSRRTWLVAEKITLADLSVAGMMTYARIGHLPFDDYSGLAKWYARVESLDAWRALACKLWEDAAE